MSAPIRVVFLGCGFITGVHSSHLKKLGGLFVAWYASRDRARAVIRRRFGGDGVYGVARAGDCRSGASMPS